VAHAGQNAQKLGQCRDFLPVKSSEPARPPHPRHLLHPLRLPRLRLRDHRLHRRRQCRKKTRETRNEAAYGGYRSGMRACVRHFRGCGCGCFSRRRGCGGLLSRGRRRGGAGRGGRRRRGLRSGKCDVRRPEMSSALVAHPELLRCPRLPRRRIAHFHLLAAPLTSNLQREVSHAADCTACAQAR